MCTVTVTYLLIDLDLDLLADILTFIEQNKAAAKKHSPDPLNGRETFTVLI